MKTKEIREKETSHLEHELADQQKHLFDLRAQAVTEKLEDPSQIAKTRRTIARMKTILKQMAQWDSFVDVLNQLDQIIKLETGVKDRSEKLQKKETDSLFDK